MGEYDTGLSCSVGQPSRAVGYDSVGVVWFCFVLPGSRLNLFDSQCFQFSQKAGRRILPAGLVLISLARPPVLNRGIWIVIVMIGGLNLSGRGAL